MVLAEAQVRRLEELRVKIRFDEERIETEMERYQVGPQLDLYGFQIFKLFFPLGIKCSNTFELGVYYYMFLFA